MKNWLKVRFIAGIFVTLPAIATAWILWIFWSKIDDFFAPMYFQMLGRSVPGLGFLTAAAIILLMGIVARNVVGRRVLSFGDKLLYRVPVFRLLYPSIKMLIDSFSPERRNSCYIQIVADTQRNFSDARERLPKQLSISRCGNIIAMAPLGKILQKTEYLRLATSPIFLRIDVQDSKQAAITASAQLPSSPLSQVPRA